MYVWNGRDWRRRVGRQKSGERIKLTILKFLEYSTLRKLSILHIGTQGLSLQKTSIIILRDKQKYKMQIEI